VTHNQRVQYLGMTEMQEATEVAWTVLSIRCLFVNRVNSDVKPKVPLSISTIKLVLCPMISIWKTYGVS
jgi:hypothetical protein